MTHAFRISGSEFQINYQYCFFVFVLVFLLAITLNSAFINHNFMFFPSPILAHLCTRFEMSPTIDVMEVDAIDNTQNMRSFSQWEKKMTNPTALRFLWTDFQSSKFHTLTFSDSDRKTREFSLSVFLLLCFWLIWKRAIRFPFKPKWVYIISLTIMLLLLLLTIQIALFIGRRVDTLFRCMYAYTQTAPHKTNT